MLQIRGRKKKKRQTEERPKKKKKRSVSTILSGEWMGTKPQRGDNLGGKAQVGSGAWDRSAKRH